MARAAKKTAEKVIDLPTTLIKIGSGGERLPIGAPEWVAVLDQRTNLMATRSVITVKNWNAKEAERAAAEVAGLSVAGFTDWRIPEVEEIFPFFDRHFHNPAVDDRFFPDCPIDWFWTKTDWAPSPRDFAWIVYSYYGNSYGNFRDFSGLVRAVRAGQ